MVSTPEQTSSALRQFYKDWLIAQSVPSGATGAYRLPRRGVERDGAPKGSDFYRFAGQWVSQSNQPDVSGPSIILCDRSVHATSRIHLRDVLALTLGDYTFRCKGIPTAL
jgi:hypothetical protein